MAHGIAIDASSDVLGKLALQQLRRGGREFHDFHATLNFTDGVRVDLAMLGDDDVCEFVDTFLEDPEEAVQYPGSPQGSRRRPARRSFCCRSDSIRDIRCVRDRHQSRLFTCRGIEDGRRPPIAARDLLAIDVMLDLRDHDDLLVFQKSDMKR